MGVEWLMATKIIKAWINGAIQEIEIEEMMSPEQGLSIEDRLVELEDKPIITDGNLLVGNGTDELEEMTPKEVLSHINGASVTTLTTEEYEALTPEEINANTLYMITDEEDVWNVEVLISEDGLTLSLVDTTPINVIDAVDSGVNVRLYANISTDKIRYYSMNGRGTNSFGDYVNFVYGDSAEVDTIQISRNGRNTLIGRVVDEFASASDVVELKTKVGDITVSEQINNAVSQKSQVQIITWEEDD
jgi:hypothetical protein